MPKERLHPLPQIRVERRRHLLDRHRPLTVRAPLLRQQIPLHPHPLLKHPFQLHQTLQEFLRRPRPVHPLNHRLLQRLVPRQMQQPPARQLIHVPRETLQKRLPLLVKTHLILIHQRVIRTRLREELHHQRNRVHQHEQQRQNHIRRKRKRPTLSPVLEQLVQRQRLRQNIPTRLRPDRSHPRLLVLAQLRQLAPRHIRLLAQRIHLLLQ